MGVTHGREMRRHSERLPRGCAPAATNTYRGVCVRTGPLPSAHTCLLSPAAAALG